MTDSNLLPAEQQARRLLEHASPTRRLANAPFEALSGGHANRSWRVRDEQHAWCVRLNSIDAECLGVSRVSECRLLAMLGEAGLSPRVLHCDAESGILVTQFIEGAQWTRESAIQPENLSRLAGYLRRLHALPARPGMAAVDFSRQADRLLRLIAPGVVPGALESASRRVFGRLGQREVSVVCHNDVHRLNIVDQGCRIWLVDWEYGGRGDYLYDLASFLCYLQAGPQVCAALLSYYEGSQPRTTQRELDDACWAFDYVRWLWYEAQQDGLAALNAEERDEVAELEQRLLLSIPR